MRRFIPFLIVSVVISSVSVSAPSGLVNVFVLDGYDWDDTVSTQGVVCSTPVPVAVSVSSCAVVQGDSTDCYEACIQPNGTLSTSPAAWVTCPQ